MSLLDLAMHMYDTGEIERLRRELLDARIKTATTRSSHTAAIKKLQAENDELKIRFASLVRLLMDRGIIQPEELAKQVALTKEILETPVKPDVT